MGMLVDYYDFEHLLKEAKKDVEALDKKVTMERRKIEKELAKINQLFPKWKSMKWRHPKTKRQWELYIYIEKKYGLNRVYFYPVTEIVTKHRDQPYKFKKFPQLNDLKSIGQEKVYLLFYLENQHKDPEKSVTFTFKVFRGHFIDRYRLRKEEGIDYFEVIKRFFDSEDNQIIPNYKEKEKYFMMLGFHAISFVEILEKTIIFHTCITPEELFPDQVEEVKAYFNSLYATNNFARVMELHLSQTYKSFIDENSQKYQIAFLQLLNYGVSNPLSKKHELENINLIKHYQAKNKQA